MRGGREEGGRPAGRGVRCREESRAKKLRQMMSRRKAGKGTATATKQTTTLIPATTKKAKN